MSYNKPRLELNDTPISAVMKMAEGNPGAINVLMQLLTKADRIDPDDAFGGFGALFSLDTLDVYGSQIWQLYKDVSGQSLVTMLGLMRAVQLGYMPERELVAAINGQKLEEKDIDSYMKQVRTRLPAFGKEAP